ncbi:MAG: hypothetical protein V4510_00560 [bacterium]
MASLAATRRIVGWSYILPGSLGVVVVLLAGQETLAAAGLSGLLFPGTVAPFLTSKHGITTLDPKLTTFLYAYVMPVCILGVVAGGRLLAGLRAGVLTRWITPVLWLPLFPLGTVTGLHALWSLRRTDAAQPQDRRGVRLTGECLAAILALLVALAWVPVGSLFIGSRGSLVDHLDAAAAGASLSALGSLGILRLAVVWHDAHVAPMPASDASATAPPR